MIDLLEADRPADRTTAGTTGHRPAPDWFIQNQIEADQEARHGLLDPWADWALDD